MYTCSVEGWSKSCIHVQANDKQITVCNKCTCIPLKGRLSVSQNVCIMCPTYNSLYSNFYYLFFFYIFLLSHVHLFKLWFCVGLTCSTGASVAPLFRWFGPRFGSCEPVTRFCKKTFIKHTLSGRPVQSSLLCLNADINTTWSYRPQLNSFSGLVYPKWWDLGYPGFPGHVSSGPSHFTY